MATPILSFAELFRLGRTLVSDRVPDQSRQSLPIPVRVSGALQIAFMYSPAQALPNNVKLAPPHFVAWLEPSTGALLALRPVTPQSFGQKQGARDLLGEFRLPPGMDANQYLAARDGLFRAYEQLVPVWLSDPRATRQDLRPLAAEFMRRFALLSEPPLAPYYDNLGAEFFGWARSIAR